MSLVTAFHFAAMTKLPPASETTLAQALHWLESLAPLVPETVELKLSTWVLLFALVALWIWRHPKGGRRRDE